MRVYNQILEKTNFQKPKGWLEIETIDMHTCGEPLRVILGGFPSLQGDSVLSYRNHLRKHFDYFRTALMWEPRGHADMYGCILVPPNDEEGDFGIIFLHNEGYSTMCGHAIIAIATLAVQMKWIEIAEGENDLKIDAPCGRIHAFVNIQDGQVKDVKFHCVPSFVVELDIEVEVPSLGLVHYDLAYGGAFYAYVDLNKNTFDFDLSNKSYRSLISAGMQIKKAVIKSNEQIIHPLESDLSFLYGTIFTGNPLKSENQSRNVCVFADGEVDRCPTGSGLSGRMAIEAKRNQLSMGQKIRVESIIDTVFTASYIREETYHGHDAVIPEISGTAYVTGQHRFLIDPNDGLKDGFMLR